jgi:autotransporter-associated beta strand protein
VGWSSHYNVAGTGTFTQSAGTNSVSLWLYLGQYAGDTGIYRLSGGSVSSSNEYAGYDGIGNFVQSGGTNSVGRLSLGYNSGSQGTYDFTGGSLVVGSISVGSGTVAFNFGGGTLSANGSFSASLPMTSTGTGGKANVATVGNAIVLSGPLSGPGGLNKFGDGTLTLSAENSYTGDTAVYAGILSVTQPDLYDGSGLSIAPGAVLNLTYSGVDTVRSLALGGVQEPPGLYNAANSGGYITGTGSILVSVPEPSAFALLGIGALGLLGFAWRGRR